MSECVAWIAAEDFSLGASNGTPRETEHDTMQEDLSDYEMPDAQLEQMAQMPGFNREELYRKRAMYRQQRDYARQNRPQPQLGKLGPYMQTPRRADTPFFRDAAGSAPWFGKKEWQAKYEQAPIVFGATVQANDSLWDPGKGADVPLVTVIAMNPQFTCNGEWLRGLASAIASMRDSFQVPPDCQRLVASLRDTRSIFCWRVPPGLGGAADAWCATTTIPKQSDLPNDCLPANGVLPFLLLGAPIEDRVMQLKLVPRQYHM